MSTEAPIFQTSEREIFSAETRDYFDSQLERGSSEPLFHANPEIDAPLFESALTDSEQPDSSELPEHD